jgi:MFS family permease
VSGAQDERVGDLAPIVRLPVASGRLIWLLGLGAFGLAFSITTTAAYLPPLLQKFTDSRTLIAVVLASEGVFALALPLVVGPWSDTFETPLGRRRPFMLAALFPLGFCLSLMAFMPSIWTTTLVVLFFFFAYYVYEPPYRGLYPDLLPGSVFGRAQSVQHILRGLAIGGALVGGGALFDAWKPAPFLVAAIFTTLSCGAAVAFVRERAIPGGQRVFRGIRAYVSTSWQIVHDQPDVRRFLVANTAWEGTFAAARTFVVLYVIKGLHQPLTVSAAVLATVAVGYVAAAVCAGFLGDHLGLARVIFAASFVYGGGLLVAGFASSWHDWYYGLIFPTAVAGGIVMTLAWGLLFKLMPEGDRGAISGLATTTKGIGLLIGPLLAGVAIDLASHVFHRTDGYQIVWPLCSVPILAAIPVVAKLIRAEPR